MKSPNRILQEKYVRDLQNSKLKISVTYQGLKSQDFLFTRQDDEIHISGVAHYISGWKYTDLLCIYARNKDFLDELVMFIVDGEVLEAVRIEELELISVNPSSTVKAYFDELPVYEENICRSLSIPLPHEKKLESTVPNLAMDIAVVKKFYQYMEKTRGEKNIDTTPELIKEVNTMKSFDDEKRVREKIISTIENLEQQATTISQNILSAKNPIHLLHQHKILAYTLMQPSN